MTLQVKSKAGITELTEDAKHIRSLVFVQEQHIPADLEFDNQDKTGIHYVGYRTDNKQPVTTARIHLQEELWHVGRVATIKKMRGQGIGKQLLEQIILDAHNEGVSGLILGAQLQASDFYKRLGFVQVGDDFEEAGIPHIEMKLLFSDMI